MKKPLIASLLLALSSIPTFTQASPTTAPLWPIWPARACEIFVDRVIPYVGPNGWHGFKFWIKTLNFRLDAPVSAIGLRYRIIPTDEAMRFCRLNSRTARDCATLGKWQSEDLVPFFGARDYFEGPRFGIGLGPDPGFPHEYEVFFYVTTERGTTYRTFSGLGPDALLNEKLFGNMTRLLGGPQPRPDHFRALVPAEQFPYLNPLRCR